MRRTKIIVGLFLAALCSTCTTDYPIVMPNLQPSIDYMDDVPEIAKPLMEGVYTVDAANARFGEEVVVKWAGSYMSIFTRSSYMILETGQQNMNIYLRGYWRAPTGDATGLVDMIVPEAQGASDLLNGVMPTTLTINGLYGDQNTLPKTSITLTFKRGFSSKVTSKKFRIVGHRGGGRTSDRLPVSENSIPMIGYAERLGATGVEIDVRLTKDKEPILYHDGDLNIRLTKKGPLNGPIEDFTLKQLNLFVELIRGEKIPTLRDALKYVVDNTQLQFVWLDIKDPNVVAIAEPLQREALDYAASKGRIVDILIGVPADDVLAALKALPNFTSIPSLCEISVDEARILNSRAWGPRWTLGTQNDLVAQVQAEGRVAICWTIDLPGYINQFIRDGQFDGLLTNYPSTVAYFHYIQE